MIVFNKFGMYTSLTHTHTQAHMLFRKYIARREKRRKKKLNRLATKKQKSL